MTPKPLAKSIACLCALGTALAHAAAAQAPKDPCTLLTPSQVAGALGVKDVGAGVAIGKTGCSWQAQGAPGVVTLSFWDPNGFASMKAPLPNVTKSSVSGIGGSVFLVKVYGVPGT